MTLNLSPVLIALIAMIAIPAAVSALVRRSDRKRPPSTVVGDEAYGVLFTVRARRWNYLLLRIIGIVFIVVGGFFFLATLTLLDDPDAIGMLITAVAMVLFGILFVYLGVGQKRRRVEAYDSQLVVTPMFRAARTVDPTAIKHIRPTTNRFGGLDIKVNGQRGVISVISIDAAYPELCAWLEQRAPAQWKTTSSGSSGTDERRLWNRRHDGADWICSLSRVVHAARGLGHAKNHRPALARKSSTTPFIRQPSRCYPGTSA